MGNRSFEDLTNNLINARKVMGAVEGGNYKTGNIDPTMLQEQSVQQTPSQPRQQSMNTQRPVASPEVNVDKIKNSRLPDNIKKLMMENPIPTLDTSNTTLPDNMVDEIARKMNEQNQFDPGAQRMNTNATPIQQQPNAQNTMQNGNIKAMIKEAVAEVLSEMGINNELLSEGQNIKENLQIRVGNSIFTGKLTKVKSVKKS